MASSKVRPTPPPRGPALVRPAMGALLLTLSGAACGDDGTGDTANDSQPPMVLESEGPMPNPTTDATVPPITTATSTTDATGDGSSTGPVPPMPPPMPDPTDTADSGTTGTDTGGTTDIPPMPPPTGGVVPGDEPE